MKFMVINSLRSYIQGLDNVVKLMDFNYIIISGRMIKLEVDHLVEGRPTRPVRTAFEIIDYFKCEIPE